LECQRGGSKLQAFAAHSLQHLGLCGYFQLSSTSHHEGSDVKQQITSQGRPPFSPQLPLSVSTHVSESIFLLHRVRTTFTQPQHAGI
ncbi:hypothetical protein AMECASPLE_027266, partial [Ameca splendens]